MLDCARGSDRDMRSDQAQLGEQVFRRDGVVVNFGVGHGRTHVMIVFDVHPKNWMDVQRVPVMARRHAHSAL